MPGRNKGTNTIFLIPKDEVPADSWRDITYGKIVCNVRPQKSETNRTRPVMDSDRLSATMDCGTPTANLLTVKLIFNSIVSTPGVRFLGLDLKDFYLNTPLDRPEFLRIKLSNCPDNVIEEYNLNELVNKNGFSFIRVEKGM